ncbi:MAG TPA: SDR family NAD(P)-dependent oxidoreductase [Thermomicrobiales bacterium]
MNEFPGKVAVVTGAASGIGRAIAAQAAREGMRLVLADIEAAPLERTAAELRATGADVLAVPTDVSRAEEVAALAEQTVAAYGAVHLLFNNAGVATGGPIWERPLAEWEWVMGVNLWGVVHGIRAFVPLMLAQEDAGYIVNTASIAGLVTAPALGIYTVTKHAVVALSEVLAAELAQRNAHITVSVLCPSWVQTRILEAGRNRPTAIQNAAPGDDPAGNAAIRQLVESGMPPEQVAEEVFAAIRDERFYILTHPETKAWIRRRMETILATPDA